MILAETREEERYPAGADAWRSEVTINPLRIDSGNLRRDRPVPLARKRRRLTFEAMRRPSGDNPGKLANYLLLQDGRTPEIHPVRTTCGDRADV